VIYEAGNRISGQRDVNVALADAESFSLYDVMGWNQKALHLPQELCSAFTPNFIMDIQIATLCDFASDYNGKLVISGTFDTLAARSLPVVHPACALALRFCFTQEDVGRHQLSINIINEDGVSLDSDNMPIKPEFDVQLPKNAPFLTRNVVMNLQGLRFPEDGIYSIDIGCDGEILVRLPLRVVHVQQGPNDEAHAG
jgi:hypothetical protein